MPLTEQQITKAIRLAEQGRSRRLIADALGVALEDLAGIDAQLTNAACLYRDALRHRAEALALEGDLTLLRFVEKAYPPPDQERERYDHHLFVHFVQPGEVIDG